MGCLVHEIQLAVKLAYEGKYHGLLLKTCGLVGKNHKSSITLQTKVVRLWSGTVLQDGTALTLWFRDFWRSRHLSTKYLMK